MATERRHDMGPVGSCICPKCGEKRPHIRGMRCQQQRCPACGAKMLREGSDHHRRLLEKKAPKER